MNKSYIVLVNKPIGNFSWPWTSNYFPRKVAYLKEAKTLAQMAIDRGATMARVEYPDGRELDFRPKNNSR